MKTEIIRSRQNKTVKLLCSLLKKKDRAECGLFRFDGFKLLAEAIRRGLDIEIVTVREDMLASLGVFFEQEQLALVEDKLFVVSGEVFEKISEEKSPEGVITVAKSLDKLHKIATINNIGKFFDMPDAAEKVMLLEAIRDPGNLGTVIRSAASLGIGRLVISSDCAELYNPKTIRAAMGALFVMRVDILPEGEMGKYIGELRAQGRRVFAAALRQSARELGSFPLQSGDCFVIGNEGHGLCHSTISACDDCVIIPMAAGCESLNASAAASIFIWETSRI